MIELQPVRESKEDADHVEVELLKVLRDEIFLPLIRYLGTKEKILNSLQDLVDAIKFGRISFYRGKFTGRFSAKISRELKNLGATWNHKDTSWDIQLSSLPVDVRQAIAASEDKFTRILKNIDKRLSEMSPDEIAEKIQVTKIYDRTIFKVNKKFEESVKGIAVAPKLTQEQQMVISEEYANNMRLYIKDWAEEQIKELRQKMQTQVLRGARYESAVKTIQSEYEVSRNKAKFLARQETSLLTAKLREVRYQDAGIFKYRWRCVSGTTNHPVRPMHKALDGKIFEWSNPPVVDKQGTRKNPGEDYNCRCTAIPVVT